VPPSGACTTALDALDAQRFVLYVTGADGFSAVAGTSCVPCPAVRFFAARRRVPRRPGAERQRRGGPFRARHDKWSQATGRIYVLYNDPARGHEAGPAWESFVDAWRRAIGSDPPSPAGGPAPTDPRLHQVAHAPGRARQVGWATDLTATRSRCSRAARAGNWL
jgi:hypothetical protein